MMNSILSIISVAMLRTISTTTTITSIQLRTSFSDILITTIRGQSKNFTNPQSIWMLTSTITNTITDSIRNTDLNPTIHNNPFVILKHITILYIRKNNRHTPLSINLGITRLDYFTILIIKSIGNTNNKVTFNFFDINNFLAKQKVFHKLHALSIAISC